MHEYAEPYYAREWTEEEEAEFYAQQDYYAKMQKEHDDSAEENYQQHLRELHERAFERGETFIDV